ncbi:MAG TPA: DUF4129 domain-containing protein [Chloroflexia bacterium]|nr:DUF4129 domain-containing protein [Chloroflexia bacterium]
MSVLLQRLRGVPARTRWAGLAAIALMVALLGWYFFFRSVPGQGQIAAPPPPRPAIGKTLTYREYTAAILSALSDVRKAKPAALGDEREELLKKAAGTLEGVEGAGVPARDGGLSEIDNTAIIDALRAKDPDVEDIEASLSVLAQGLQGGALDPVAGTLDGEQATGAMREVLNDPIFDYEQQLSPLQRLARWLAGLTGDGDPNDVLWRWFSAMVAAIAAGALAFLASDKLGNRWARLGLAVLVGLLVGALFFAGLGAIDATVMLLGAVGLVVAAIVVGLLVAGLGRGSAPSARPPAISELAAALGMNAAEARRRAGEAAGEGDYRGAIRYRCLAVLLALDEVGRLTFDRAATNREYLFRAPGTLQEELQPLLARFDAIWYGGSPTNEEEWAEYSARAARIEAQVAA